MLPILKPGDVVDIVAPAFGCSAEDVAKSIDFLRSWGLGVRVAEGLLGTDLLCANADSRRAETLYNALTNDESKAVWAIRGGYGSARLLDYLGSHDSAMQKKPPHPTLSQRERAFKLFLGFSDITMLHLWLGQNWGWPTLHAPTLLRSAKGEVAAESLTKLKAVLFGEDKKISYDMMPLNKAAQSAEIKAEITGGNLSVIASGIGTDWQIDASGKILFLEEVDERGYRIDRMLTQLRQSRILGTYNQPTTANRQPPTAIIFGDFSGGDEPDGKSLVTPVIERFVSEIDIPCFRLAGIGHEAINNPLPFGIKTELSKNNLQIVF